MQRRTAMQLNWSNPRSQLKRKTMSNQRRWGDDLSEEDEAEEVTEDVTEEMAEGDKAEEATVEVVKAISAHRGKCVKKNSHAIEPDQSKKPAKKKNKK